MGVGGKTWLLAVMVAPLTHMQLLAILGLLLMVPGTHFKSADGHSTEAISPHKHSVTLGTSFIAELRMRANALTWAADTASCCPISIIKRPHAPTIHEPTPRLKKYT